MGAKMTNPDVSTAQRPRLVKAEEVKARVVASEEERRVRRERAATPLALVRAPRDAAEARDMFDSLFKAA